MDMDISRTPSIPFEGLHGEKRMPFVLQVTTLTWRYLVTVFRTPAAVIPSLLISVFFLLVYNSTLGGASNFLPGLAGKSYLGFILCPCPSSAQP